MRWVDGESIVRDPDERSQGRPVPVIEPTFTVWHLLAIGITLAAVIWLWVAERTRAEAFPVRVILSHVPTVSTWGPPQATGVALITFSEGDVRADFVDLPVLDGKDRYALWLLRSKTGEAYLLGKFDAKQLPVTHVDLLLPEPIPDAGWDTVLVTVEPEPDPDATPDARRVLIGALPGTPVELELLPPTLPQTGKGHTAENVWGLILVNAGWLVAIGLGRPWRRRPAVRSET
ncbi:MAG: hypothetical protein ACK42I_05445 [Thermomicrobium sp.]